LIKKGLKGTVVLRQVIKSYRITVYTVHTCYHVKLKIENRSLPCCVYIINFLPVNFMYFVVKSYPIRFMDIEKYTHCSCLFHILCTISVHILRLCASYLVPGCVWESYIQGGPTVKLRDLLGLSNKLLNIIRQVAHVP